MIHGNGEDFAKKARKYFEDDAASHEGSYGFNPVPLLADRSGLCSALLRGLQSPVCHQRSNCVIPLGGIFQTQELATDLFAMLADETAHRWDVIRVACDLDLPIEEHLRAFLFGPDRDLAYQAAYSLGAYPGPATRAALRKILEAHHSDPRIETLYAADLELDPSGACYKTVRSRLDFVAAAAAFSLAAIAEDGADLTLLEAVS